MVALQWHIFNIIFVCLACIAFSEYVHYAILFRRSMKGPGTRVNTLIRLTLTRSEIDLAEIKTAYFSTFAGTLQDRIAVSCTLIFN